MVALKLALTDCLQIPHNALHFPQLLFSNALGNMQYSRFEPNSLCKFGGQIPCDHAPQLGKKAQKNLGESDELSGSLTFSPQQSIVPEGILGILKIKNTDPYKPMTPRPKHKLKTDES